MRTVLITGGTDGIGRALALHCLGRGDRVVAVGSSVHKGAALQRDGGDRCVFLRTDLTSAAATSRLAGDLRDRFPRIDALVLGAFRYQPVRQETAEGLERTFALYVMSRFLLAEALRPALDRAPHPVVVNLCGTGLRPGPLRWDDLQLRRRYRPITAVLQGARANDLLGVAFTTTVPGSRIRYVLHNPGFVRTGMTESLRRPSRTAIALAARLFATPVEAAVPPILTHLDTPPAAALSAFRAGRPLPVTGPAFAPAAATRLTTLLRSLARGQ